MLHSNNLADFILKGLPMVLFYLCVSRVSACAEHEALQHRMACAAVAASTNHMKGECLWR